MKPSRCHELRAAALSNLKLPSPNVAAELVVAFKSFLKSIDHTDDVVGKLKPNKRKDPVVRFLHSLSCKGSIKTFWPVASDRPSEPEIIEQLSNFMLLDVGKIPRHLPEAAQSSQQSKPSKQLASSSLTRQDSQQHSPQNSQQESQDPEIAAALRANDKRDKQDPTYVDKVTDYVQDTSRETRRISNNLGAVQQAQRQSPIAHGLTAVSSLSPKRKHSGLHVESSRNQEQIQTPPPSEKRLGKRPATTDPFHISDDDDDIPFSETTPDVEASFKMPSPERAVKRAKFGATIRDIETTRSTNERSPLRSDPQVQIPQASSSTSTNYSRASEQSTTSTSAPVPAPRVDPKSFLPSTPPKESRDIAIQCQIAEPVVANFDHILLDIKGLEHGQLFQLPLMFLDSLRQCREAHVSIGTSESRVRAAVLRDVEDNLRKVLNEARS